ncbi:LacI family DNA-binding transcriptional regulator [Sinorhizobium chiapasense]|uniref:LacI family DNA-binding transcriptional regulator n=1 Tax=Sinorhizobium chiapasense TaxID=501572 RepID=A0ABZ2BIX5_9HYPH
MGIAGKNGAGAVRIADVARHADVGAGTVSRVLNGSPNVTAQTRERVMAAIQELGYVPNLVARGLAANRTGVVAAIIPVLGYAQHSEVIQGMLEGLKPYGITVMIGSSGYSEEGEERVVEAFLARRPDAIYVTGGRHSARTRELLKSSGIPVIEGSNLHDNPIDTVIGYSNFDAARKLTARLFASGRKHVAHVTFSTDPNDRIADRLEGYRAACRELGLPDDLFIETTNSFEGGAKALRTILDSWPEVDGIFFVTDVLAVGALHECQRRGIAVPEHFAICGFDDLPIAASVVPALTTARIGPVSMGRKIAEVILARIKGEADVDKRIDVGFQIIERESAVLGPKPP